MQFSVNQIASFVGGTVEGDGEAKVSTFAKIEEGHEGSLTFLANPKYTHCLYTTEATAVLVSKDFKPLEPFTTTLIRVDDPYQTLSQLMRLVDAQLNAHPKGIEHPSYIASGISLDDDTYVGAFAYIGEGSRIGHNVKVYPQSYIGRNVVIGDDTVIYPGVKIYHGSVIGKRCVLQAGCVIGGDGFGFAPDSEGHYNKIPQMGIVVIEDDVEIGANTTVDRATMGKTQIGRGTKLDNLVQIAHNVSVGEDTVMAAQAGVAGSARIGSRCMVGGQVGVAGHISVGDNVQVGAQSGIPNNVASGSRIMGYPAVDYRNFLRQSAYIRRLPELFDAFAELERTNKG